MTNLRQCISLKTLPRPIGDTQGLVVGERLMVFGGASGTEFRDEIIAIDRTGECEEIGRLPYAARGHQIVEVNGNIYFLGGFDGRTRNDVHRLDLSTGKAEKLAPMPVTNSWFGAAAHGGKIVIPGGFSIPTGYLDGVYLYDPDADEWTVDSTALVASPYPKNRVGGQTVISDGARLIAFGGADVFDTAAKRANALSHVCSFDTAGRAWSSHAALTLSREGMAVAVKGRTAYLVGGMPETGAAPSNLVERVDLDAMSITEVAVMSTGRLTPAAGIIGDRLIVAGGVTRPGEMMTDSIDGLDLSEVQSGS